MRFSNLFPIFVIFVASPGELFAYLDPGTGSILIQGLIAVVATGLATGKFWWHRVKGFFSRSEEAEEETDDGN
jgi:hypothetical protein